MRDSPVQGGAAKLWPGTAKLEEKKRGNTFVYSKRFTGSFCCMNKVTNEIL